MSNLLLMNALDVWHGQPVQSLRRNFVFAKPFFEVCVEFLHHAMELVLINLEIGTPTPEELEVLVLLGWLIETKAMDLIETGGCSNHVKVILGHGCLHLRIWEWMDVMNNVSKVSFTDVLRRESHVLLFESDT